MQHIVVGIDGSAASRRALHWAVDHARMSGADLQVIHAWTVPDLGADPLAGMIAAPAELEAQARRELDLVLAGVDERALPGRIEPTLVRNAPAKALLDAAKGVDLLVVGSRGLGVGNAALVSVSHRVISEASCPVVVVPPDSP